MDKICTLALQIYCLSVSHNSVIYSKLDTSAPPFWMAWYLHCAHVYVQMHMSGIGYKFKASELQSILICDVIKQNELELANTDFMI